MSEPRRYTDEEFALVLRKALALQERGEGDRLASEGLTLEQMRSVAREVGVDPALVDRAAALIDRRDRSTADRILGGPTTYRVERETPHSISPDAYSVVVDAVRRVADHHGEVRSELDSLVWQTVGQLSQVHVTIIPREDRTEIRVTADRSAAFVLTWFLPVAGGMMGAGILGAVLDPSTFVGGAALFLGMASAGLATARALWARGTWRFRQHLEALLEAARHAVEQPTQ